MRQYDVALQLQLLSDGGSAGQRGATAEQLLQMTEACNQVMPAALGGLQYSKIDTRPFCIKHCASCKLFCICCLDPIAAPGPAPANSGQIH